MPRSLSILLIALTACGPAGKLGELSPAEHFAQGCTAFEKGNLDFAAKHLAEVVSNEHVTESLRYRASLGLLQSQAQVGSLEEFELAWQVLERDFAKRLTPEIYLGAAWEVMCGSDPASIRERIAATQATLDKGSRRFPEHRGELDRFHRDLERFEAWLEKYGLHWFPGTPEPCWGPAPLERTTRWVDLSVLWLP